MLGSYIDTVTDEEIREFNKLLAKFIFGTALPFNTVGAETFKALFLKIRPAYAPHIPSPEVLGDRLLDEVYQELNEVTKRKIKNATMVSICSDGWEDQNVKHHINFVAIIPKEKPIFIESVCTKSMKMTGKNIAKLLLRFIERIGAPKVTSVVTDTAKNMQAAWAIIEAKYPHIHCNGCAAHVMNLLIKDILSIDALKAVMTKATAVVKVIRRTQRIKAKFDECASTRADGTHLNQLVMPSNTRWYSQYTMLTRLHAAQWVIRSFEKDECITGMPDKAKREAFLSSITDPGFWGSVETLIKIIEKPSLSIGQLESDKSSLDLVYHTFSDMVKYYTTDPAMTSLEHECKYKVGHHRYSGKLCDRLKAIAMNRWVYINTQSMSMSYLLSPNKHKYTSSMTDYQASQQFVANHAKLMYKTEAERAQCMKELSDYLEQFSLMEPAKKEYLYGMSPSHYWGSYANNEFPLLAKVAHRLYYIPTSSASTERCWSVFALVHSKRRNRLCIDKVEKLVFIYCNACFFTTDRTDYAMLLAAVAGGEEGNNQGDFYQSSSIDDSDEEDADEVSDDVTLADSVASSDSSDESDDE